jgi:hypothetical protein
MKLVVVGHRSEQSGFVHLLDVREVSRLDVCGGGAERSASLETLLGERTRAAREGEGGGGRGGVGAVGKGAGGERGESGEMIK